MISLGVKPNPPLEDRWLSPARAREYLGVASSALDKYVRAGLLHPKRLPGGDRRFLMSDLDALLDPAPVQEAV